MTRAERRARRRARGDARARVARAPGRSIPSRRNRVRVFSSDRFFSFRFRAGSAPASAAASASASRAASDLTRPFRTPPDPRCAVPAEAQEGPGRRQGEGEGRARVVALRGPFLPRSARRRLARRASAAPVGRRPRPAPAAGRQEARQAFRGRPSETPRRVAGGVRSGGADGGVGAAAQARAATAGVRLRRRSGRVHHRRPVHPTWAGHSRRDAPRFTRVTRGGARELDGAPGSATPRAPGARKTLAAPRSPRRRAARRRRRPALAARPRRGRGALQRARRVRGGRCGAADGDRGERFFERRERVGLRGGRPRGVAARGRRRESAREEEASKDFQRRVFQRRSARRRRRRCGPAAVAPRRRRRGGDGGARRARRGGGSGGAGFARRPVRAAHPFPPPRCAP